MRYRVIHPASIAEGLERNRGTDVMVTADLERLKVIQVDGGTEFPAITMPVPPL